MSTAASVLNAAPAGTELGLVVRPVGAGVGGATVVVEPVYTATSTVAAYNAANQVLLAADAGAPPTRHGFSIFNNTDRALYVKFGGAATAIDFSVAVQPNQLYESQKRIVTSVQAIGAGGGAGTIMVVAYTI
jgi:hypothetical protein